MKYNNQIGYELKRRKKTDNLIEISKVDTINPNISEHQGFGLFKYDLISFEIFDADLMIPIQCVRINLSILIES